MYYSYVFSIRNKEELTDYWIFLCIKKTYIYGSCCRFGRPREILSGPKKLGKWSVIQRYESTILGPPNPHLYTFTINTLSMVSNSVCFYIFRDFLRTIQITDLKYISILEHIWSKCHVGSRERETILRVDIYIFAWNALRNKSRGWILSKFKAIQRHLALACFHINQFYIIQEDHSLVNRRLLISWMFLFPRASQVFIFLISTVLNCLNFTCHYITFYTRKIMGLKKLNWKLASLDSLNTKIWWFEFQIF